MTPMTDPIRGPFGHGLLERLDPIQFEIDDLVSHIGRSIRENNLKIVVDDDAKTPIEAIQDPTVGTIVRVKGGARPQWITPQAVAAQDIEWLRELVGWLYQIAGMDEGAASQQAPAQYASGRALQYYHDFQSLRYSDLTDRLGRHVLGIVERVIDAARRLHAGGDGTQGNRTSAEGTDRDPGWEVRYARGSETRTIRWSEVDMERDAFVIELEEASAFPDSLAGRMQQIEQDAAEGRIPPDELVQKRLDPDLESHWDRQAAAADYVDWLVERLTDPGLPVPRHLEEAGQSVRDLIVDELRAEVMRSEVAREDREVIERLEQYLAEEVALSAPPPPDSQTPGLAPALPTGAEAGAPPPPGAMLAPGGPQGQ
jgi:hypothetical protein